MNRRGGFVLIEVLVALAMLGAAGLAFLELAGQSLRTLERARQAELRVADEDRLLAAYALLNRRDLGARVGWRRVPEAERVVHAYRWPGNVRELQHVMENVAALVPGDVITADDVLSELEGMEFLRGDRDRLRRLLAAHEGNVRRAAGALGVPRGTLRHWLAEVDVTASRKVGRPSGSGAGNGPGPI